MASGDFELRPARLDEAPRIFQVVNDAYSVELGDTGLAFKNADRYNTVQETERDIARNTEHGRFVVAVERASGDIVGCVNVDVFDSERRCDFGPFAVLRTAQGRGLGTLLLQCVESKARAAGCTHIQIEVVNHRTDLLPYYGKRGFREVGTAPCDAAHNCDESKVTRPSHFVVLRRDVRD